MVGCMCGNSWFLDVYKGKQASDQDKDVYHVLSSSFYNVRHIFKDQREREKKKQQRKQKKRNGENHMKF